MLSQEVIVVGLAVSVSLVAILVALFAADFARRASGVVILAAGILIVGVTLFHLAPEAAELGVWGIWAFIGGVVLALGLELAGRAIGDARVKTRAEAVSGFALFALAIHSAIDGAIYSVSFSHDQVSGLLVGLGLVLHEAPEGAVALMLAYQSGLRGWRAIFAAVFASSLTTPIGWAIGSIVGGAAHEGIELLFAGSAGLLAYSGVRLVVSGVSRRGKTAPETGSANVPD